MKKGFLDRISPFSLTLVMVVLMVIGVALMPSLRLSYNPTPKQGQKLTVSTTWKGASSEVMEAQVVSPIEATLSTVVGIDEISSTSSEEQGKVFITLKEGVNVASKRFEISTLLRQISESLPDGVSYPELTGGQANQGSVSEMLLLSYTVNADMELSQIAEYISEQMVSPLSEVKGVTNVWLTGSTTDYLDVEYDPQRLELYGLSARDIATSIRDFLGRSSIIGDVDLQRTATKKERITLLLQTQMGRDLGSAPITSVEGRMIYLRDVATIESRERSAERYFRINGMNTINLTIYIDGDENVISMSDKLLQEVERLKNGLDDGYYITLSQDKAEEIRTELFSLVSRTLLALIILLLFVLAASRSWRYLSIVAITLAANIFIAVIFYYLFNVELHLFSLAGITVSFGIIIDTSIVMVDHYNYYRNRTVFSAILAALITTIGSLVIIFFMPDYIKENLTDFASVIIINLGVSLIVSLLFVPALIDRMKMKPQKKNRGGSRRVVRWNRLYISYISFVQRRKWIYIILMILAFGLPVHLLPATLNKTERGQEKREDKWYETLYNKSIGSPLYQQTLKEPVEYSLGGALRLFSTTLDSRTFSRREQQTKLTITARLTEGNDGAGNGALLNVKMVEMDRFLSTFEKIQRFETSISGDSGRIVVEFADSIQKSSFPQQLESEVISRAISIGGVDWSTYGVSERGFSNSLNLDHKSYSIELTGYNFQRLRSYANELLELVSANQRASDASIESGRYSYYSRQERGLAMQYDGEKIALYQINLPAAHAALTEQLNEEQLGEYKSRDSRYEIDYHSSQRDRFDLWSLMNQYIKVGESQIRYSHIAAMSERNAKQTIDKRNQEYTISVAFNFLGSYTLADRFTNGVIDEMNARLPVGFVAKNRSWGWYKDSGEQYWLILLIIVIIFFMCSILFESLRQPLVIISLIPLSFIGTFFTYYFTKIPFGTGGFASLVLLSGLVVNSAIYLINEYNTQLKESRGRRSIAIYAKAYNHKIIPILLTVLSTALGLIPFLMDSATDNNSFWFSFAVGSISGLLFSVVALVFFMPILMNYKNTKKIEGNE
ncbi:MAG: efflux RND transporter permease subunit [Rikenellaceae bacterium]